MVSAGSTVDIPDVRANLSPYGTLVLYGALVRGAATGEPGFSPGLIHPGYGRAPMASTTRPAPDEVRRGPLAVLRRVDDLVYSIEQSIVVTFLSAMTIMVFLDVVDRRLTSPDSKLGQLIVRIFGVEDPASQTWVEAQLAPIVGAVLGIAMLWFAVSSVRQPAREARGETGMDVRALGIALATAAAMVALGWLMIAQEQFVDEWGSTQMRRLFPSKYVYMLLYGAGALPWSDEAGALQA